MDTPIILNNLKTTTKKRHLDNKEVMTLDADYFTKQIITYIGNKRSLLEQINSVIIDVKSKLNKDKIRSVDLFSGSGIVARLLKQHSSIVIANDLEMYSETINSCFLSNTYELDTDEFKRYLDIINRKIKEEPILDGIISGNYAPKDELNITINDRCFYSKENAIYIDSFRYYIDEVVPSNLRKFFLAELITEASIHVNTCGVFKGFYKDKYTGIGKFGGTSEIALNRILSEINIQPPILSPSYSEYIVYRKDAVELSSELPETDLVYLDPPYNQHPYGSNYFMLNLILENKIKAPISKISGIPSDWNHSSFNKPKEALNSLETIVKNLNTSYVLISYNNEGFISEVEMIKMLEKYGKLSCTEISYNTFRGCRNLDSRDIHTKEYLFLLEKDKHNKEN